MVAQFNYQLYYEKYRKTLETLWEISTDYSITRENRVKIIRDVSRAALDGQPTPSQAEEIMELCEHEKKTYQAPEKDTNVPELYTCDDCGEELDIPEPDWDLMNKE